MTPEQEEQVRRALGAAAQHDRDPAAPPQVVARLDEVLADLTADRRRSATGTQEPGVAQPHRADELVARRRRRGPRLLVAAAAVAVVAGAGVAVVHGGLGGGTGASSSSAGSSAEQRKRPRAVGVAMPSLRSGSLHHDVLVLLDAPPPPSVDSAAPTGCTTPPAPRGGRLVAVRLDGRAATLVLGPDRGGRRIARVYACRHPAAPLARTTVGAP